MVRKLGCSRCSQQITEIYLQETYGSCKGLRYELVQVQWGTVMLVTDELREQWKDIGFRGGAEGIESVNRNEDFHVDDLWRTTVHCSNCGTITYWKEVILEVTDDLMSVSMCAPSFPSVVRRFTLISLSLGSHTCVRHVTVEELKWK